MKHKHKEKQDEKIPINQTNNETIKKTQEQSENISKQEFEELKDTLQRTHAEFQNFRKRTEEEKSRFIKLSNEALIKKLIPVIDNLEIALKHEKQNSEFKQGIQLIQEQIWHVLEEEGLSKITAIGKFDPNLHEAVLTEESELENGTILKELQKGYALCNRVIRFSKVKIAKKTKDKCDKKQNSEYKNQTEVNKNE